MKKDTEERQRGGDKERDGKRKEEKKGGRQASTLQTRVYTNEVVRRQSTC